MNTKVLFQYIGKYRSALMGISMLMVFLRFAFADE